MYKRLTELFRFIRGDFIIIKIESDSMTVDAENFDKEKLKEVASAFFKQAYML